MEAAKPLAPKVRAELDGALARQRSLQSAVDALSLDATLDHKVRAKLEKLEGELATATTAVTRLRKAHDQALQRDRRALEEAELAAMRAGLVEFRKLAQARAVAASDLDDAVAKLADAYFRLRAGSQLVSATVPEGLRLPQGYLGRDLKKMCAHLLHKASAVSSIGDVTLPGAASPNHQATHDADAIPAAATVIAEENDWLIGSLEAQIEAIGHRRDIAGGRDPGDQGPRAVR
jgi:hypothetical protein